MLTYQRGAADVALLKTWERQIQDPNTAPAAFMHPAQKDTQNDMLIDPQVQQPDEWQQATNFNETPMRSEPQAEHGDMQDWNQVLAARRFIDPQPNAERVEFGDGFSQLSHVAPSSSALGKRPARFDDEDGIDPSQDAGFQTDNRNIDVEARRRLAPVVQGRSLLEDTPDSQRKRARFDNGEEAGMGENGEVQEGTQMGTPSASNYQQIKEIAKQNRKAASAPAEGGILALPTSSHQDGRRIAGGTSKRQWTQEEEEALVAAIARIGCSWSEIKRDDDSNEGTLKRWSQVDLKDKAIGIKAHILQASAALPTNFEHVSLRRRDKDRLRNMGINPDDA